MFNQVMNEERVLYRAKSTTNKFAEYETIAVTIQCRLEEVEKLIRSAEGSEVISVGQLFTKDEIKRNDKVKIDDIMYRVEKVQKLKDITGKFQHNVAYLV